MLERDYDRAPSMNEQEVGNLALKAPAEILWALETCTRSPAGQRQIAQQILRPNRYVDASDFDQFLTWCS
jgi:hypothetical protein